MPPQQSPQDDLFGSSSRVPSVQGSFRFSNQASISQAQGSTSEEFPPLNRNVNGDIGQERSPNLMSSLGFGSQASSAAALASRNNGLLNAVSANARGTDVRSPTSGRSPPSKPRDVPGIVRADLAFSSGSRAQDSRTSIGDDEARQKSAALREESLASQSSFPDGPAQGGDNRSPLGAIGKDAPSSKPKEDKNSQGPEVQDPLAGMPAIDKFGLKGLRTLMNNYPDYNALIVGLDPSTLGLDLTSTEYVHEFML